MKRENLPSADKVAANRTALDGQGLAVSALLVNALCLLFQLPSLALQEMLSSSLGSCSMHM